MVLGSITVSCGLDGGECLRSVAPPRSSTEVAAGDVATLYLDVFAGRQGRGVHDPRTGRLQNPGGGCRNE